MALCDQTACGPIGAQVEGELNTMITPGALVALFAAVAVAVATPAAPAPEPGRGDVLVGLTAEFGDATSTSDEAIRMGIQLALDEVNAAGGVLGGRRLALVERDNRSVPARMVQDVRELAALPDLVAVFCGKFAPAVIEAAPVARSPRPLLDPWAAADPIIDDDPPPGWTFRLSLRDSWAIPAMARHLAARGIRAMGLLAVGSSWGRSNEAALRRLLRDARGPRLAGVEWFDFGAPSLLAAYEALARAGAQGILLVANESEGATLVRELAALPRARRLPIASHWEITGGDFPRSPAPRSARWTSRWSRRTRWPRSAADRAAGQGGDDAAVRGGPRPTSRPQVEASRQRVYDLTLVLARAIELAGTAERGAIRDALERVRGVEGLVRRHERPFGPGDHEALRVEDVFMARFAEDGTLVRARR